MPAMTDMKGFYLYPVPSLIEMCLCQELILLRGNLIGLSSWNILDKMLILLWKFNTQSDASDDTNMCQFIFNMSKTSLYYWESSSHVQSF